MKAKTMGNKITEIAASVCKIDAPSFRFFSGAIAQSAQGKSVASGSSDYFRQGTD